MTKIISSRSGRIYFMAVILAGGLGAFITLKTIFGDGAVSVQNYSSAVFKIVGFYLPVLTLIATFYFKENLGKTSVKTPFETFAVALIFLVIWVLAPIYFLATTQYIEDVFEYFDKLAAIGQTLVMLPIGYYFSKPAESSGHVT